MTTIDSDFTPKRSKIVIRLVKFQCHADHLHLWQVETIVLRVRETAYIISLISRLNDKSHCFHDRLTALLKLHYRLISNIDKLHKQPERIYGTCTFHRFESRFKKFGIVETKGRERERTRLSVALIHCPSRTFRRYCKIAATNRSRPCDAYSNRFM